MATYAERQDHYRKRLAGAGLVQVTVILPEAAVAEFKAAAEAIRTNPVLTIGPLRNPYTGRLMSIKSALTRKGHIGESDGARLG